MKEKENVSYFIFQLKRGRWWRELSRTTINISALPDGYKSHSEPHYKMWPFRIVQTPTTQPVPLKQIPINRPLFVYLFVRYPVQTNEI